MDKQKQIEEMIRDLIPFLVKEEFVEEVLKQPFSYFDDMYEDEKAICKELIRLNYRKIPEGGVVLTREEYKELKYIKKCVDFILVQERRKVRKETAEKFAEMLKEQFIGVREYQYRDTGTAWGEPCIGGFINNKIDKVCKEITEGKA